MGLAPAPREAPADWTRMSMDESLLLSLKAKGAPANHSLPFLIQQINSQRGSFRNVTEESLEQEIADGRGDGGSSEDEATGTVDNAVADDIQAKRNEILAQAQRVYVESSQSLEFVSLLLSTYTPAQVEQSLGFLKRLVPLGSLNVSPVQPPRRSEQDSSNDAMVALGWTIKSLNASADSLLGSAKRLKLEVQRETKYWQRVLEIKKEGWSPFRKPNEPHTLAVRYGSANRGIAALRRNDDGAIDLDFGAAGDDRRLLIAKIVRNGRVEGFSGRFASQDVQPSDFSGQMMLARRSLFDVELFAELQREARTLISWDVKAQEETIQVPISETSIVELNLREVDETSPNTPWKESSSLQAETVLTILRILLAHAHEDLLRERSKPPGPIKEKPPPKPTYALIRPLLEHFSHAAACSALRTFINSLSTLLSAAKLPIEVSSEDISPLPPLPPLDDASHSAKVVPANESSISLAHLLVSSFLRSRESNAQMTVPSLLPKSPTLRFELRTQIAPPQRHGTSFRAILSDVSSSSTLGDVPAERTFPDIEALKQHVLHLLRIAVTEGIMNQLPKGWGSGQPHLGRIEARTTDLKKGAGLEVAFDQVDNATLMTLRWRRSKGEEGMSKTWHGGEQRVAAEEKGVLDVVKETIRPGQLHSGEISTG